MFTDHRMALIEVSAPKVLRREILEFYREQTLQKIEQVYEPKMGLWTSSAAKVYSLGDSAWTIFRGRRNQFRIYNFKGEEEGPCLVQLNRRSYRNWTAFLRWPMQRWTEQPLYETPRNLEVHSHSTKAHAT